MNEINHYLKEDTRKISSLSDQNGVFWVEDRSLILKYIQDKRFQSVEEIRYFFQSYPEELLACRRMGRIIRASEGFLQVLGIESVSRVMENLFLYFPIESLSSFIDELVAVYGGESSINSEICLRDHKGNKFFSNLTSVLLNDDPESPGMVLCTLKPYSESQTGDFSRYPEWQSIIPLVDTLNIPVIVWEHTGKVVLINHAFSHLTTMPKEKAQGCAVSSLFTDNDQPELRDFLLKTSDGSIQDIVLTQVRQKSGDIRMILWHAKMVESPVEKNQYTIVHGLDITEQIWAKEFMNKYISELIEKNHELELARHELLEMNSLLDAKVSDRSKRIEELLQQKDEFITRIGHDLKTPLTPLLAILPVIKKREQDPRQSEYLEMAIRNANQIHDILQSMLQIARLNTTYIPGTRISMSVHQMMEEIIINYQVEVLKKKIIVDNRVPDDIQLIMNPIDFDTIFSNLIDNAIKYSQKGGTVTIEGERTDVSVIIRVTDTGVGLLPIEQKKIFEKFYKADPSRHDGASHGLGLSVAQNLIEKYGGTIIAQSEGCNQGTCFTISFPIRYSS